MYVFDDNSYCENTSWQQNVYSKKHYNCGLNFLSGSFTAVPIYP